MMVSTTTFLLALVVFSVHIVCLEANKKSSKSGAMSMRMMMMMGNKKASKMGGGKVTCHVADYKTAYHYQLIATKFATLYDDITTEKPEDSRAFYDKHVAPYSIKGLTWIIETPGAEDVYLVGKEQILGLFEYLKGRRLSFSLWSSYETYECDDHTNQVIFKYGSVVPEAQGNYIDYFGEIYVYFDSYGMITKITAKRTTAIDRGYEYADEMSGKYLKMASVFY